MTRTKRFLGGLAFGYANQFLMTLVGLWLTRFLLARLGQEDYGLWLVATPILSYLLLMDLGVVALLPRETAAATGRAGGSPHAAEDLPVLIAKTIHIVLWQLPFVALVAFAIWLLLPSEWEPLARPLGAVMVVFVILFPARVFQALLEGLQDLSFIGSTSTVRWATATSLSIGLVLNGWGLYSLAWGWVAGEIVAAAMWWLRLRSRFRTVLPSRIIRNTRAELLDRMRRGGWLSIQQIAQVFLTGTELLIIGKVLGPATVVPFFCTAKLLMVLRNQPQLLTHAAGPGLSELRAGSSSEDVQRVCTALTQGMLLASGAIVCVILVVNEGFVAWWVGSDRYLGFPLTAVLLLGMLLRHWNSTAVYTIFAYRRDRRIALTTLFDGLLTVSVSILLVSWIGPVGAPIGSIVGVCVVSLPGNLTAMAQETHLTFANAVKPIWQWAWRFALLATGATLLAGAWVPDDVPSLIAAGMISSFVYAIVMLPLMLRDPLGIYVRPFATSLKRRILG